MKLITKFYLAIGFVMLLFATVTTSFLWHSSKEEANMNRVMTSMEILKQSETMQKTMVDMQTGLRGYIITGNASLLDPYFAGYSFWQQNYAKSFEMLGNPDSERLLKEIDQTLTIWKTSIADEIIEGKLMSQEEHSQHAFSKNEQYFRTQVNKGDLLIAQIRAKFDSLDTQELIHKEKNLKALKHSLHFTRYISIVLTLAGIILAVLTAILLAGTLRRRIYSMLQLAENISHGDFNVRISEIGKDEMSRLAKALNRMAFRLQKDFNNITKINRELDQFAYVVSHDLKAPLRAINNLAEWIAEDITDPDPDIQKNLKLMRGRVQRMEDLINGILAYAKIDRKEFKPEMVSVMHMLQDIADLLPRPATFEIVLPASAPSILTQKILLEQVFTNLISNAIKYNNKEFGRVVILWREQGDFLEFSVTDNGPGIPEQFQEKVFGIFQTMEARDTKESTGVGLAIVKKIIDEKGGKIWIVSKKNEYTSFIFTWPVKTPSANN